MKSKVMISGSKKDLLDLVKKRGRISIEESAEATGLAKTTLREHYSYLERKGYVKKSFARSGPGRPSLCYELTPEGHRLFQSFEPKLLHDFIVYLTQNEHNALLEDFFEEFWERRYKAACALFEQHGAETLDEKIDILAKMLEKEGFMPEYNSRELKECNCPFAEIVKVTKLPCQLEKEFLRRLLGKDVERTSYIPDGAFACSYSIK